MPYLRYNKHYQSGHGNHINPLGVMLAELAVLIVTASLFLTLLLVSVLDESKEEMFTVGRATNVFTVYSYKSQ